MPCVGFETTMPMFERAKAVHALDRAATVIGGLPPTDLAFKTISLRTTTEGSKHGCDNERTLALDPLIMITLSTKNDSNEQKAASFDDLLIKWYKSVCMEIQPLS
jgi:hypothetical protein